MEKFSNLGVSKELLINLKSLKLINPTPVQQQAIQPGIEGKDILAIANTGTGKTAAFGIPIIQKLNNDIESKALILAPTRELSIQINSHLKDLMGKNIHIKSTVIIGGDSIKKQEKLLKQNPRLFIGTPGRIYDHLNRKNLKLDKISILVLDETDRMLDLGFIKQIQQIAEYLPNKRQTLLFSATLPKNMKRITEEYLHKPIKISVEKKEKVLENISHNVINLDQGQKYERLLEELYERVGSIIIFMKTKHSSKRIYLKLQKDGLSVNAIHGNVRQNKRISILNNFRDQKFRILVATDIAARGLDIPHIEHVINYDLPQRTEDYIHRIGRTARAGKKGSAISFVSQNDKKNWNLINKLISNNNEITNKFEKEPINNFKSKRHNKFKNKVKEEDQKLNKSFHKDKKFSKSRRFNKNNQEENQSFKGSYSKDKKLLKFKRFNKNNQEENQNLKGSYSKNRRPSKSKRFNKNKQEEKHNFNESYSKDRKPSKSKRFNKKKQQEKHNFNVSYSKSKTSNRNNQNDKQNSKKNYLEDKKLSKFKRINQRNKEEKQKSKDENSSKVKKLSKLKKINKNRNNPRFENFNK
ncbi:MAG: DEAD/DEAH box helicase [Alphaproteobacteria bacterium]